ncbi:hypothetical protein TruAng_004622 [Truncatella angustata]|nr:hypothetical protein TruAng_004622 [Truncatella angustata]
MNNVLEPGLLTPINSRPASTKACLITDYALASAEKPAMESYVVGVDVGGTNTDAVLMNGKTVVAWHKSPSTADVSSGVSAAIKEVLAEAGILGSAVPLVKIGTTQFLNATLERDGRKMDKVAVIRLCGPYTQSVAPFLGFPHSLRRLIEGHHAFVDGGKHVDGREINPWSKQQLSEQAQVVKEKGIRSILLAGIHSPSFPDQEDEAACFLSKELGSGYDVSCSHHLGNASFLERENTAILNASIRRFSRQVTRSLEAAVDEVLPGAKVFLTLNDGTISPSWYAARYPLKCFFSGPTNSARGAAFMAMESLSRQKEAGDDADLLVVDVGGTTTDVCGLLPNGYPKHSAAFVKIAGVKTNLAVPQTHNIGLGGGSIVRQHDTGVTIGPDSVGADELTLSLATGGSAFTASDTIKLSPDRLGEVGITNEVLYQARDKIKSMVETAVEFAKTKPLDANVILVGGGSFIVPDVERLRGIAAVVQPQCYQVANAIGAAIAKVSGRIDRIVTPQQPRSMESLIEDGKKEALQLCYESGGRLETAEIVNLDIIPETYSFDGSFRMIIRAVSDFDDRSTTVTFGDEMPQHAQGAEVTDTAADFVNDMIVEYNNEQVAVPVDISTYVPQIQNDIWTLSETDVDILVDGTGILGVGCAGEATNYQIALKEAIRLGQQVQVVPPRAVKPEDVICPTCWIGSPTAFFERIPGNHEMREAIYANLGQVGKSDFTYTIPTEIGGPNALEALLLAAKLGKKALDADVIGRAFPKVYMTIPALHGKSIAPAAICDGNGVTILLKSARDDYQAEEILRTIAGQLGGIASLAFRPFSGDEIYAFAQNSYSLAWMIGRSMQLAREQKVDVASTIVATVSGRILFRGKVNLVSRQVQNSFTRGTCTILPQTGEDNLSHASWLELVFENEILAANLHSKDSQSCLATTPDLFAIIDATSGQVVGITELRYGLQVAIVAFPAPEIWYSEEGLKRGGPVAFGLPQCESSAFDKARVPDSLFDKRE